jgi:hypothetical protein
MVTRRVRGAGRLRPAGRLDVKEAAAMNLVTDPVGKP